MRKKRCCIISSRFPTISSQFFAIFHKTEVLTVILRCWTGLNHNWFKSSKVMTQNATVGPFHSSQFSPLVFIPLWYHFVFSFVSLTNCQNGSIKMWIYLWRNNRRIRSSWTRQYLFVWFIPAGLVCSKSQYKLPSPCSWCRRGETLK